LVYSVKIGEYVGCGGLGFDFIQRVDDLGEFV